MQNKTNSKAHISNLIFYHLGDLALTAPNTLISLDSTNLYKTISLLFQLQGFAKCEQVAYNLNAIFYYPFHFDTQKDLLQSRGLINGKYGLG